MYFLSISWFIFNWSPNRGMFDITIFLFQCCNFLLLLSSWCCKPKLVSWCLHELFTCLIMNISKSVIKILHQVSPKKMVSLGMFFSTTYKSLFGGRSPQKFILYVDYKTRTSGVAVSKVTTQQVALRRLLREASGLCRISEF